MLCWPTAHLSYLASFFVPNQVKEERSWEERKEGRKETKGNKSGERTTFEASKVTEKRENRKLGVTAVLRYMNLRTCGYWNKKEGRRKGRKIMPPTQKSRPQQTMLKQGVSVQFFTFLPVFCKNSCVECLLPWVPINMNYFKKKISYHLSILQSVGLKIMLSYMYARRLITFEL